MSNTFEVFYFILTQNVIFVFFTEINASWLLLDIHSIYSITAVWQEVPW